MFKVAKYNSDCGISSSATSAFPGAKIEASIAPLDFHASVRCRPLNIISGSVIEEKI